MAVPVAWCGAAGPGQEGGRSLWGKARPRGPPVPWGSAVLRAHTLLLVPPALGPSSGWLKGSDSSPRTAPTHPCRARSHTKHQRHLLCCWAVVFAVRP